MVVGGQIEEMIEFLVCNPQQLRNEYTERYLEVPISFRDVPTAAMPRKRRHQPEQRASEECTGISTLSRMRVPKNKIEKPLVALLR
jgi:hypothetical protein